MSVLDKQAVVAELLSLGHVMLRIDARRPDVIVPATHAADLGLALRLGYNLVPRIFDLAFTGQGWSGTLAFAGSPFHVTVPWSAVWAAEGAGFAIVWELGETATPVRPTPAKPKLSLVP